MSLTREQVESYFANGYLKAEGVFDPSADLGPVIRAYEEEVDRRARTLRAEGRLSSLYEGEDFAHRLARIAAEVPEAAQALDIYLVRHPAMFRFLCHPTLHDVVESLLGPEILCHPCQHLRAVAPTALAGLSRTTDWHQDAGVLWPEADHHLVVTTWIPLIDVPEERGCLQVLPGSHRYGLVAHGAGAGNRVPAERFPPGEARPLPVRAGDMILFHNYVLHAAVPNASDAIRWSMDLRWQDPARPTGRPHYPGFIVRSAARPETVQHDYDEWRRRWEYALAVTKGVPINRWQAIDKGLIQPTPEQIEHPTPESVLAPAGAR
jgi:ectoine hydroxylase-related dioxygenase (phytanoyl-CoA dioxygenase family)